jgi:hypothetical protein
MSKEQGGASGSRKAPVGARGTAHTWVRQNVLGLVAIFIALSGTAVAAQMATPHGAKTAKAKKGRRGPAGPAGPQGSAGLSTGPAGGDLTGTYPAPTIANDAVGPAKIQNAARSVNLPLGSFYDVDFNTAIPFTGSGGINQANFVSSTALVIEYDAAPGPGQQDDSHISTTLSVPPDYASGGSIAIRASKSADFGAAETLSCNVSVDGSAASPTAIATITSAANTAYTLTPSATYAPGDSVALICNAVATDNFVYITSIEFRYTATQ